MLDLFGCVAISTNDVELWIDNLPNFTAQTSSSRREQYSNYYDLASIITAAKLDGRFQLLELQQKRFIERRKVPRYQTQYAKTQAELDLNLITPCSDNFHICLVKSCKIRQKLARSNRNKRHYRKKTGMLIALSDSQKTTVNLKSLINK